MTAFFLLFASLNATLKYTLFFAASPQMHSYPHPTAHRRPPRPAAVRATLNRESHHQLRPIQIQHTTSARVADYVRLG